MVRAFDMFCGGGGSGRGAHMAGAKIVGAVDMWDLAAETYRLNFPKATVYEMPADELSPRRVSRDLGKIDLLLASPECTSHSVAKGNKRRCEKSRATAFEVVRFAETLKPRWIVVENVMQMQKWRRFKEWLTAIQALGYKTNMGVLDAQDHGAPQTRRRLFVVADREAEPVLPASRRGPKRTVGRILGTGERRSQPWAFSYVDSERRAAATLERAKRAIAALGKKNAFIMVYYGSDGAGGFQTLDRPLRTITTLDRFALVRPNGRGHEMRMLQPPELAAAMGFPDYHRWKESPRRDRIKLIGNGVCPPMMHDVVHALMSPCIHNRPLVII